MNEMTVRDIAGEARAIHQQDLHALSGEEHRQRCAGAPGSDDDHIVHLAFSRRGCHV
jgi:hypothetical protein